MNTYAILEKLVNEVAELRQEIRISRSEKTISETPSMVMAFNEAKKGNYKALQLAAKKRFEENSKMVKK